MTKSFEIVAAIVLVGMFLMVGLNWSALPDQVPVHFNASGTPDKWGSKDQVWILPVVATGLYAMLTAVTRVTLSDRPRGARQVSQQLLTTIKALMVATLAFISYTQVARPGDGLGRAFLPVMLFLPLGVVAWSVARMRRFSR